MHHKPVFIPFIICLLLLITGLTPAHAQRTLAERRYQDSVAAAKKAEKTAYLQQINSIARDSALRAIPSIYTASAGSARGNEWFISRPVQHQSSGQDALFYVIAVQLLGLGLVRAAFPKYYADMFRLFFRVTLRQQSVREQLSQNTLPSLLLNLLFFCSGGLFLTQLSLYYGWAPAGSFWYALLFWSVLLVIIYTFKLLVLQLLSWLFRLRDVGSTYSFIVFLINKVAGVMLLPFVIFMGLGPSRWQPVIVTLSFILLAGLFMYRYLISYPSVKNTVRLNRFHFIIYLCALEILPLLLIYKGLELQLSRN